METESRFNFLAVGDNVMKYRKIKGYTQKKLSKLLDKTITTISRVECGRKPPSLEMLVALSEALDVSVDELMEGVLPGKGGNETVDDKRLLSFDEELKNSNEKHKLFILNVLKYYVNNLVE